MSTIAIISSFADEAQCARAIEELRAAKVGDFNTFSPIPSHKIEHAIGKQKSPVRWIVLAGGISGVLTGLAITIGTTYEWRLNAGGKPLLSWPPFIIICFELMVLLGGIFGFLGVLVLVGYSRDRDCAGLRRALRRGSIRNRGSMRRGGSGAGRVDDEGSGRGRGRARRRVASGDEHQSSTGASRARGDEAATGRVGGRRDDADGGGRDDRARRDRVRGSR